MRIGIEADKAIFVNRREIWEQRKENANGVLGKRLTWRELAAVGADTKDGGPAFLSLRDGDAGFMGIK